VSGYKCLKKLLFVRNKDKGSDLHERAEKEDWGTRAFSKRIKVKSRLQKKAVAYPKPQRAKRTRKY